MLRIRVPGSTSNLGSGFDTFGLALQIYFTIEVEIGGRDLKIQCTGEGENELPADEGHLVYRAIESVFRKAGKSPPGMTITAHNDIPLSRGLGSSGAACIAGLIVGVQLSGHHLSDDDILTMANDFEGHPENAASSYHGGLTVSCLTENGVCCKKISVDPRLQTIVLIPDIRISTDAARKILPDSMKHSNVVFNLQRTALLAHAFLSKDYSSLKTAMQDRLHQPYRSKLIPGFDDFQEVAYQNGALAMAISGSGSTLICFTDANAQTLLQAWQQRAEELQLAAKTRVLDIDNTGIYWRSEP